MPHPFHNMLLLEDAVRITGPAAFNIMLKPAGSLCNLDCHYCYYLDKAEIYGGREPRMTEEMLETVRCVGDSGVDGIKLQLLHVLEGTDLAALWRKGQVPLPTMEAYIALLEDCLAVLPPELVIHRLTGDGAKRDLLAPLWTGDKKRVLNAIRAAFDRDNVVQGSRWRQP